MAKNNRKTIFCDIDGSLIYQVPFDEFNENNVEVLPGVAEKFKEWKEADHYIVLTTARPSSLKHETLRALDENGLIYHAIIFDLGNGSRYVINDIKEGKERAFAINVERDKGIENIEI